jgi:hypothetical protein
MANRVIRKVTLSSTPYSLFQWYPQSNEILLNLSLKCWNSAFNAQGSRLSIVVVQVGAVEIYVTAGDTLRWRKDRMKLSLLPKLVEKLVWVLVVSFAKIFIRSYKFDAFYAKTGCSP